MKNFNTQSKSAKRKILMHRKKRLITGQTIYVHTASEALALLKGYYTLNPFYKQRVWVKSSALSPKEAAFWSNSLTHALNDCGCGIAAAFLLTVLVIWTLGEICILQTQSALLPLLGKLALCITLGLIVGKTFGVAWAKWKLRMRVHEFVATIAGRGTRD